MPAPTATLAASPAAPAPAVAAVAEPGSKVMTGPTPEDRAEGPARRGHRVDRANGITEYTNVRPRDGRFALLFSYISTCVACDVNSTIDFSSTRLNLEAFKDEIAAAAGEFGVDPALLRALMHAESAFNPMAISSKGAQGLMQLMPGTASDLGVDDAFDVNQNIRGGAMYIARMLRDFGGDERLATAAYNAGPGAVQRYGDVPPFAETRVYVQRVATLRERYRRRCSWPLAVRGWRWPTVTSGQRSRCHAFHAHLRAGRDRGLRPEPSRRGCGCGAVRRTGCRPAGCRQGRPRTTSTRARPRRDHRAPHDQRTVDVLMPSEPLTMPWRMIWSSTALAVPTGMAKPMPSTVCDE